MAAIGGAMVLQHWNLVRDPFGSEAGTRYVATPGHEEAVARLVQSVEAVDRRVTLVAAPGLGKSAVVVEALRRLRSPQRRLARVVMPIDGAMLYSDLAGRLGRPVPPGTGRAGAWRALADAARLCRLQGISLVLAVDDAHCLAEAGERRDLDRLEALDPHPGARLTVIRSGRPADDGPGLEPDPWELAIRLNPLTRSQAGDYLRVKLAAAGRAEVVFTPRAITCLHALARGVPRGLDRLASLALLAGALRGREVVGPEIVEGVATECHAGADL